MNADTREAPVRTRMVRGMAAVARGAVVAAAALAIVAGAGATAAVATDAAEDRPPDGDEARRQQLRQHARQIEQLLGQTLNAELELARQACDSLEPEARRRVLGACREGVRRIAGEVALRQFEGGNANRESPRVREALRAVVADALRAATSPEQFARYEAESLSRAERRHEAARLRLVARLDESLSLSDAQREAILADLRVRWDDSWDRLLGGQDDIMINNRRLAPDFAEARITPHLDPDQLREWRKWCQAANSQMMRAFQADADLQLDGQGPAADPWWSR